MDHTPVNVSERDAFAKSIGIICIAVGPGWARLQMRMEPRHLNGVGIVHGGALFTLADAAFAVACNSRGAVTVAIQASITFVKAATGPLLWAEAREIKDGKIGSYEARVTQGETFENSELVAVFNGVSWQRGKQVDNNK